MRNKNSCSHKLVGVTFQTKSNGQGKGLVIIFQKKISNEILEVENYNLIKNQILSQDGCFKLKVNEQKSITLSRADYNRLSVLLAGYDDKVSTKSAATVSNIFRRVAEEVVLNAKGIAGRLGKAFSLEATAESMNPKNPVTGGTRAYSTIKRKKNYDAKLEKSVKAAGNEGQRRGSMTRSRVVPPSFNEPKNVRQSESGINFSKYQNLIRKKEQDDEQQALVT